MKMFIVQFVYGYLLLILASQVETIFLKKLIFGWGAPAPYPGYPFPGYLNPGFPYPGYPPPPPPGFGGLLGKIVGKLLLGKFGAPPPYPYPPPFPPAFGPPFGFPAFPAALPIPVNVPVPFPVDRPIPVPFGKPSLLPPITIVKHVSDSSKGNDGNNHGASQLFQMRPPEKSSSSWTPMHVNHKEEWF